MELAHPRPVAAAAVAPTNWATTATALATWIVASWTPAVSPRIAWKSAWSAAESASPHRQARFDGRKHLLRSRFIRKDQKCVSVGGDNSWARIKLLIVVVLNNVL